MTYDKKSNAKVSKIIKDKVNLETSPVAIKLFLSEDKAKEVLEKITEKGRHCEMLQKAAHGKSFYLTAEEETCNGGAIAIGLKDAPEEGKYFSLRKETGKDVIAVGYAPLEDAPFEPDVVSIICTPVQALQAFVISQSGGYNLGTTFESNFSGKQSLCADGVSKPYVSKKANLGLGCAGSRKFAKLQPEELVVGIPGENLEYIEKLE